METLKTTIIKQKHFNTPEKPQRQSARLWHSSGTNYGNNQPSFVPGYVDGQPVYSIVRVLPQEFVFKLEDEMAWKKKENWNHNQVKRPYVINAYCFHFNIPAWNAPNPSGSKPKCDFVIQDKRYHSLLCLRALWSLKPRLETRNLSWQSSSRPVAIMNHPF
jgi:hypothetical protein